MTAPGGLSEEPPRGVRVVTGTGRREIPLETRYDGVDDDGSHLWTAVFPVGIDQLDDLDGLSLRVDVLPPRTQVRLSVAFLAGPGPARGGGV